MVLSDEVLQWFRETDQETLRQMKEGDLIRVKNCKGQEEIVKFTAEMYQEYLGVRYNSKKNKYYAEITFTGTDRVITLSEWNTAEEAFEEYKIMKKADILLVVAKYKQHIPDYIYNKFLTVEVKPY